MAGAEVTGGPAEEGPRLLVLVLHQGAHYLKNFTKFLDVNVSPHMPPLTELSAADGSAEPSRRACPGAPVDEALEPVRAGLRAGACEHGHSLVPQRHRAAWVAGGACVPSFPELPLTCMLIVTRSLLSQNFEHPSKPVQEAARASQLSIASLPFSRKRGRGRPSRTSSYDDGAAVDVSAGDADGDSDGGGDIKKSRASTGGLDLQFRPAANSRTPTATADMQRVGAIQPVNFYGKNKRSSSDSVSLLDPNDEVSADTGRRRSATTAAAPVVDLCSTQRTVDLSSDSLTGKVDSEGDEQCEDSDPEDLLTQATSDGGDGSGEREDADRQYPCILFMDSLSLHDHKQISKNLRR